MSNPESKKMAAWKKRIPPITVDVWRSTLDEKGEGKASILDDVEGQEEAVDEIRDAIFGGEFTNDAGVFLSLSFIKWLRKSYVVTRRK